MDALFHQELDKFCKDWDIDEINLSIKQNTEEENQGYYYCNLDDNEYQFGIVGDIPTNYESNTISMEDNNESLIKHIEIIYNHLGKTQQLKIENNNELLFSIFLDLLQRIGGEEFLKNYINKEYTLECVLTTIKVGESHYTF